MYRIPFLLLILVFTSCQHIEVPKSKHKDGLVTGGRIGYVKLEISTTKVQFNKTEITNFNDIPVLVGIARDTAREDTDINAILYIDKNCGYLRADSVIRKLRESAVFRYYFKTNSLKDSSYIHLTYAPNGAFWDSLDYAIINTTKLQRDSLNILVVNKQSNHSYIVNDSILGKAELKQILESSIRDSINCNYIINPGIENTISDVIEMTDVYNLVLNEKKESYSQSKFGQSHNELEDSLKWDVKSRFKKLIKILPKK